MEAEQNSRVRNKLIAKREDFSAVISPQTFQKFKSMKRVVQADSQKSNANGSTQQTSDNETHILKVTAEEYDQMKQKYTKNKKIVKQRPAEQQFFRSKSKSPSSLKVGAKTEDAINKREKSTSPRNSGVGVKQNGKTTKTKTAEKTSPASRNNLKPENKPVSRKSYDVADSKTKTVTGDRSRWSAGMVSSENVEKHQLLGIVASNRESSSRLGESSRVDMLENAQEKKGRQKASLIPKSPNKQQANNQKKDKTKKRNSIEKDNKNKTPKCPNSKDHNSSDKEKIEVRNGECSNNNSYANNPDKKLESGSSEYEMNVELITNQIKQIKIKDVTPNKDLSNELGDTRKTPIKKTETDPNVSEGNRNIMSNDCLKKCSDSKLVETVGPTNCEDKKETSPINGKILSDKNEDRLVIEVAEKFGVEEKIMEFPFVTKRMDESLATDILQPSVDLDYCLLNNLSKCDAPSLEKDSNDNNFSTTKYQAVPGTSKTIEIDLDHENLQASLVSTVATKLAKKITPTARTPIMLKTPKRLKDGEIMSEMLIYKLGSHSTPRKIRKNRNLDSFRKSDWGTPATDRITSTFLKRKISKKIKGKMFIKKTSQGSLQPLPLSKLVPKNSPRKESPRKSTQAESGDETYKVVPVSDLIKKFENLEKEEESAHSQSKVTVTFKKNAIFEKWQNGAKNIQKVLKEVEKKPLDIEVSVDNKETNETPIEIAKLKINSTSEQEKTPISDYNITDNNENFNSLTILNTDCIDAMSFVSLKFDQIYSDECNDQTGKNMRFSDLYKEINFQLSDCEKNEAGEKKTYESPKVKMDDSADNNLESVATSAPQNNNNNNNDPSSADKTVISNNNQENLIEEEGTDVLKNLQNLDKKNCNDEEILPANQSNNDQAMDGLSSSNTSIISNNNQGQGKVIEEGTDVLKNLEHCNGEEKIVVSANQSTNDQAMDGLSPSNTSIISNNNQGRGKVFEEGADVLEILKSKNSSEELVSGGAANQSTNNEDGFRGFEDVIVAEGRIDTTGEDRASPAYEAAVADDVIKDEDFGESYRQKLLSMDNSQEDDDDTSISSLLALSQKLSKQPTSYADYRKQFMAVKSRSLPPQKINRCDADDPKMSL
ncbi:hypothetical protein LSTR_LSTR010947 [Laodelphax striatellus]|uniref:Uncharacterized protein n=1 Tax=Laodelphax striatellus TaxID=195883 RepID=A0A482XVM9_LAOST|nr:hypothetical protein LSTR_LSTR010947 [Laodelphax striatellus]